MTRLVPFFIVSLTLHGLFLYSNVPWSDQLAHHGHPEGTDEYLFVEVVAEKERTADAPTPAAMDSLASKESLQQKEPQPEETLQEEPPPTTEQPVEEPVSDVTPAPEPVLARESQAPQTHVITPEEKLPEPEEKPKEPEETEQLEKKEQETPQEAPQAVASISQVASRRSEFRASHGHDLADFKAKVIAAVKKASFYPKKAARKRQRGRVVVRFRIWKDGRVDGIEVIGSSKSKVLDKAALEIIKKAIADFPDVPEFFLGTHMVYAVPILFRERHKSKN